MGKNHASQYANFGSLPDLLHYMTVFFIYADKPPEFGTLTKKA